MPSGLFSCSEAVVRLWPVYWLPKLSTPSELLNSGPDGASTCRFEVPTVVPGCSSALGGAPDCCSSSIRLRSSASCSIGSPATTPWAASVFSSRSAVETCRAAGLDRGRSAPPARRFGRYRLDLLCRQVGARQEVATIAIQAGHPHRGLTQVLERCLLADQPGECGSTSATGSRLTPSSSKPETLTMASDEPAASAARIVSSGLGRTVSGRTGPKVGGAYMLSMVPAFGRNASGACDQAGAGAETSATIDSQQAQRRTAETTAILRRPGWHSRPVGALFAVNGIYPAGLQVDVKGLTEEWGGRLRGRQHRPVAVPLMRGRPLAGGCGSAHDSVCSESN